jgi:UDP-N-acetylmuramoyl-tripeptide--D-alanyl-D-alanine ligase
VPLTLARMPRDTAFGVFEIGMNHPGEIAPLAALVRPDVAIITTVERAHIGLMGSIEAIAHEKAAIMGGLVPQGVAVLPRVSDQFNFLRGLVPPGIRVVEFPGTEAQLVALDETAETGSITARVGGVEVYLTLRTPGIHMAFNALAVLAAAHALGLDANRAAAALDGFSPFSGRGARRNITVPGGTALLLDESYNASEASMRAAFAVLKLQRGRRVAVLGDMLELGEHAAAEHLGLRAMVEDGADIVFTAGPWSKVLFESLPQSMQGAHAETAAALAPIVLAALEDGDIVLVKGSYGSRMRDVISALESPG